MALRPLYGHDLARTHLLGALRAGRLPQALLFEGPQGVGKQRLALWLAQALLCEQDKPGEACGTCRSCRLVSNLSHPDLHWFIPLEPNKKGADADKQVELVEAALGEELALRRERPLYEPPSGMAAHSIAAVRLLLRRIILTPAIARLKVFIVGDAQRLIAQQSSPEAANALLRALEEPPADTVFVLTAAEPKALLPTILSRVVRVRLGRVPDSVVTSFIHTELPDLTNADRLVDEAEGSIGRVLALRGSRTGRGDAAAAFLATVHGDAADRYAAALRQTPFQARGGFTDMLDGLLERLRHEARAGGETRRIAAAIAMVMDAREHAQGNVNPQLLAAVLADGMAEV